jgi:hypothetical protein
MSALWDWVRGRPYVWLTVAGVVGAMANRLIRKKRLPTLQDLARLAIAGAGLYGAFVVMYHLSTTTYDASQAMPWAMSVGAILMGYASFLNMSEVVVKLWHGDETASPTRKPAGDNSTSTPGSP